MPNLKGMNVEALMNLRDQVDKRLLECRAELEKQLAALTPKGTAASSSLKGRKVPPKYRSPSGETWAGRGARPRSDPVIWRCPPRDRLTLVSGHSRITS
jgi:DNA-binding protein H-NS